MPSPATRSTVQPALALLYARESLLAAMPPWQGGGDMILSVSIESSTYNELPWRFEAGTPNISGAVGLGAALEYVESLGRERDCRARTFAARTGDRTAVGAAADCG